MLCTLTVRPREDDSTKVTGQWLIELEDQWAQQGRSAKPVHLGAHPGARRQLELHLTGNGSPDVVGYYGHGEKREIGIKDGTGPGIAWPLIDLGNCHLCAGRAVYTVACWSACELGPAIVSSGKAGTAYFGYRAKLWVPLHAREREALKAVVNAGLTALHERGNGESPDGHFRAARRAIYKGYAQLNASLVRARGAAGFSAMNIGAWKNAFWCDWVGAGPTVGTRGTTTGTG